MSLEVIDDLLRQRGGVVLLTTTRDDGTPWSRPVTVDPAAFTGTLRFLTDQRTGKVSDLLARPRVSVSLVTTTEYLTVAGTAVLVTDPEVVAGTLARLVPGSRVPVDPAMVVVEVVCDRARLWRVRSGAPFDNEAVDLPLDPATTR